MVQVTKNIEPLIDDGGEITLGALPRHECAATAADGSMAATASPCSCVAMARASTLKRLDKAIGLAWSGNLFIDEVNDGESDLL